MTKRRQTMLLVLAPVALLLVGIGASGVMAAETPDAKAVLKKVVEKYKAMPTYKSKGTATSDIDYNGHKLNQKTQFTIVLKKPDLYRITWNKSMSMSGIEQTGAVWNDGTERNLFLGLGPTKLCIKQKSDEMAIASATGISDGAASIVPSLFLKGFKTEDSFISRIEDPKIEKTEKINGKECYVIAGHSKHSKKEVLWVSKDDDLIMKYSRSLEPPEGQPLVPEMNDEEITKTLKKMGREVTEENKQQMRDMMARAREMMKDTKISGTNSQVYTEISSPELDKKDFQYEVPEGTEYKESLMDALPGGGSF